MLRRACSVPLGRDQAIDLTGRGQDQADVAVDPLGPNRPQTGDRRGYVFAFLMIGGSLYDYPDDGALI